MGLTELLSRWRADPSVGGNIAAWRTLPARPPRLAPLPDDLHPALANALRAQGIAALYTHQHQSWLYAKNRQNVVIATGTASGKTLCYDLPILDHLLRTPSARALYLFPTKALTHDQFSVVSNLLAALDSSLPGRLQAGVYDGDTPASARQAIRTQAQMLFTNPDMLHTGILPHHPAWAEFFGGLRFVVIDELHTYRGVFGSHVANVLRRLQRIAHHYGAAPQFILASATIANPAELAARLIEAPVALVEDDGSASGPKHLLLYNPPLVDATLGVRRSVLSEATRLAEDLLTHNVQTIIFSPSRRMVELLVKDLRQKENASVSATETRSPTRQVRGYRSGYLASERRAIERGLQDGSVRVVAATTALELGIDIGGMGAALLAGYPGTIASARQQMGRAGRGDAPALALLIASASPLDQFLTRHPEYFFERSPEQALINPDHPLILLHHLRCAAFELPFGAGDSFGSLDPRQLEEFLEYLREEGVLRRVRERYFWLGEHYPAQAVSLRSASPHSVILQSEAGVVGLVDRPSAAWMAHPGAIYLHEGQSYLVETLDLENGQAQLRPIETDYYTEPRSESRVVLETKLNEAAVTGGLRAHGELTVTMQVVGFRKLRWGSHEPLGFEPLDLPPETLHTSGYWLTLADETVEKLKAEGLWSGTPNDYGPAWVALTRQVRARDGYRCQMCGVAESGRAHAVHHKIPFRQFASAAQANQLSNLITLCPACHRRAESAVRIRSGLAGLAFVLTHLAPLFLMCDGRDLGVHADPQSPLADGKPVVVLYDRLPGGIGFSVRLFDLHEELIERAREQVAACGCADGCPSCVGPGGEGGSGGKQETKAILQALGAHSITPPPKTTSPA